MKKLDRYLERSKMKGVYQGVANQQAKTKSFSNQFREINLILDL